MRAHFREWHVAPHETRPGVILLEHKPCGVKYAFDDVHSGLFALAEQAEYHRNGCHKAFELDKNLLAITRAIDEKKWDSLYALLGEREEMTK